MHIVVTAFLVTEDVLKDRFECTIKVPLLNRCPFLIPRLFAIYIYDTYKNVFCRKYNLSEDINIWEDEAIKVRNKFKKLKFPEIELWKLMAYTWPSNIRGLKTMVLNTKIDKKTIITLKDPPFVDNDIFTKMFGKRENDSDGLEQLLNETESVKEYNGIKLIEPFSLTSYNNQTYDTKKKLTLLDLWNYETFKKQRETNKNAPQVIITAGLFVFFEDLCNEKYNNACKLIDEALISAERKIYEKQAIEMFSNPKAPKKPTSLEELEQLYNKLGTNENVAAHFGIVPNTVYTWKRKFKKKKK